MNRKFPSFTRLWASALFLSAFATTASAQIDLYVLQIGDGTEVSGDFRPLTVLQYSGNATNQTLINSWTAPNTDPSDRITMAPSFTTYGYLNLSQDGSHLVFAGRDVEVGQAQATATRAVIGTFNLQNQTFDTSTRPVVGDGSANDQRFRSAASIDGTQFWFAGQTGGVQYTTLGGTTATNVASESVQFADVQIFEGDLYVGRRAGGTRGVWVWEDLPTTAGNEDTTRLVNEGTGWVTAAPGGGYGSFQFFDAQTMFMDHLTGGVHTIEVFRREDPDSREWNLLTGAGQTLTGLAGINHLHAIEHDDQVYLFYTSGMGTTDSELWSVVWDSENLVFGTPDLLAVADDGYVFGGLVAIPEPTTYAMLFGVMALLTAVAIRRRKREG